MDETLNEGKNKIANDLESEEVTDRDRGKK
jgi:hypothetical protein